MMSLIRHFRTQRSGAVAIEYAIMAGMIALVIVLAVTHVGVNLTPKYQAVANNLK